MESPQRPGRPKQRHWHEQKLHDFSGRSRARRESRDNPWRFCPARCRRFNLDNARGDPKEDFRLAHWLLGEIRDKWVELRHHAHRNESGDCHNRRWKSLARKVARIALIRREARTQSVVPRSLLECQHDSTRQDKAAAEPLMPRHVFAKNNRSQNNCKENTKFIHRSDA
jgi:hypothetical protein